MSGRMHIMQAKKQTERLWRQDSSQAEDRGCRCVLCASTASLTHLVVLEVRFKPVPQGLRVRNIPQVQEADLSAHDERLVIVQPTDVLQLPDQRKQIPSKTIVP
jgi:hypothetical protein